MSKTDAIDIEIIDCNISALWKSVSSSILIGNNLSTYLGIPDTMSVKGGRGASSAIKVDSTKAYAMAGK